MTTCPRVTRDTLDQLTCALGRETMEHWNAIWKNDLQVKSLGFVWVLTSAGFCVRILEYYSLAVGNWNCSRETTDKED